MDPRIAPLEPPYPPAVAEDLAKLMPPGMEPLALFRTVAHNPRVLRRMRRGGLLDPGSITVREREIVILRITARCGSEYEWGVHAAFFAGPAGLSSEELAATVHGGADDPAWRPSERALVAMGDALHESAELDGEVWARLSAFYDDAQRIELVFLAGLYHAVSFVTNAARLPLEPWAPRFPPEPPAPGPLTPLRAGRAPSSSSAGSCARSSGGGRCA